MMSTSISSLPAVTLDYTNAGPGLHGGMTLLRGSLSGDGGREGHLAVDVVVSGATIPIVMSRKDLYILGFSCGGSWFRFDDADWPFTDSASALGHGGAYSDLGGLSGSITLGSIEGIAKLNNVGQQTQWKEALRTLLVIVAECARLIPVEMHVLGLLNGYVTSISLAPLAHYIQNWSKASKGTDMSVVTGPNSSVGFRDPTIIQR